MTEESAFTPLSDEELAERLRNQLASLRTETSDVTIEGVELVHRDSVAETQSVTATDNPAWLSFDEIIFGSSTD